MRDPKFNRPASAGSKTSTPLDDVEKEIVKADMRYLIEQEKKNGNWKKWDKEQRKVDPWYDIPDYSRFSNRPIIEYDAPSHTVHVIVTMDHQGNINWGNLPPVPSVRLEPNPYVDFRFPWRPCNKCGVSYRGPSMYCSQDCALGDA